MLTPNNQKKTFSFSFTCSLTSAALSLVSQSLDHCALACSPSWLIPWYLIWILLLLLLLAGAGLAHVRHLLLLSLFQHVGRNLLDPRQVDRIGVPLLGRPWLSHWSLRCIRYLPLRDRRHMVLLDAIGACSQIDLVEVESDIRPRVLTMALWVVQLLIVLHVRPTAGTRLQIAGLVSWSWWSLRGGLW